MKNLEEAESKLVLKMKKKNEFKVYNVRIM